MKLYRKGMWLLTIVLIITVVTSVVALNSGRFSKSTSIQDNKDEMPIADYSAPEPPDAGEATKRTAKNKRYDKLSSYPIKEERGKFTRVLSSHWATGLPAIPVEQSDIVVIGEVTAARAYLSNDKTGVYSEFILRVGEVLKNDDGASFYAGSIITAQRGGGAVRFPSGQIQKYKTGGQSMPRIGRQYMLFLKRIDESRDFSIITGYEFRDERIVPLDGKSSGGKRLQFDDYLGFTASTFLTVVRDAIGRTTQNSLRGDK
ncbi:MAG TPA: hypothetical protein VJS44_00010 [Pyrinomonadaceae bacterium]|nr:hypothetical protein [Pyrinomonadaceae bacterium]